MQERLRKYGVQDEDRQPCPETSLGRAEGQCMDPLEGASGPTHLEPLVRMPLSKKGWCAERQTRLHKPCSKVSYLPPMRLPRHFIPEPVNCVWHMLA